MTINNNPAINRYDEYGVPAATNTGRFQYTGQAWLPELSMYYYKARIYAPTLGRFMQTDPTGYDDGPNWYDYVSGDPVNKSDPDGQEAVCITLNRPCLTSGADPFGDMYRFFFGGLEQAAKNPTPLNIAAAAVGLAPVGKGFTLAKSAGGRFIGGAQWTLRAGVGSGHAHASARVAREMIVSGRYVKNTAYLNRELRTITGGDVKSSLRPDVAAVRHDGRVDITEVLSPGQTTSGLRAKYAAALGNRMGVFKTLEATREVGNICTGTRICR